MNINNAFPSKWLKSGDVEDGDLTLTVKSVSLEEVGSGEQAEQKPIIYFHETEKGMVLNKTNVDTIARLYTPETDAWIGKTITIFATEVDFAGKQTLALRVRMKAPKPAPVKPIVSGDAVQAFWAFAYQHDISKADATAYLTEAQNDFTRALALMQAQTENA
jgi:hypothetical protein